MSAPPCRPPLRLTPVYVPPTLSGPHFFTQARHTKISDPLDPSVRERLRDYRAWNPTGAIQGVNFNRSQSDDLSWLTQQGHVREYVQEPQSAPVESLLGHSLMFDEDYLLERLCVGKQSPAAAAAASTGSATGALPSSRTSAEASTSGRDEADMSWIKQSEQDEEEEEADIAWRELTRTLVKTLTRFASPSERRLLSDVSTLVSLLQADQRTQVAREQCSDCADHQMCHIIAQCLRATGAEASVCRTEWRQEKGLPGGNHTFVQVLLPTTAPLHQQQRIVIDLSFQSQFQIAPLQPGTGNPSSYRRYADLYKCIPKVFVGSNERLRHVLDILVEAVSCSLRTNEVPPPPWRRGRYITNKWFGPVSRNSSAGSTDLEGKAAAASGDVKGPSPYCKVHFEASSGGQRQRGGDGRGAAGTAAFIQQGGSASTATVSLALPTFDAAASATASEGTVRGDRRALLAQALSSVLQTLEKEEKAEKEVRATRGRRKWVIHTTLRDSSREDVVACLNGTQSHLTENLSRDLVHQARTHPTSAAAFDDGERNAKWQPPPVALKQGHPACASRNSEWGLLSQQLQAV